MLDIEHPGHTQPSPAEALRTSHTDVDPISSKEGEGTDDDRTLAEVMKDKSTKTS
jgi:hypothetical protein